MDSIYRLRAADVLTLVMLALLAVGVIMVQSASLGVGSGTAFRLTDLGQKQLVFAGLGVVAYVVISRIDYVRLLPRRKTWFVAPPVWLLLVAGACCTLVLVPHIGISRNGAGGGFPSASPTSNRRNWPSGPSCCSWPGG